jgi:hypothetical protein
MPAVWILVNGHANHEVTVVMNINMTIFTTTQRERAELRQMAALTLPHIINNY